MKVLVIQPKIGMGDMIIYLPYIHAISKNCKNPVSILVKDNSKAITFESPGSKPMASQLIGSQDINFEKVDITSYNAEPNQINTLHEHLGTVIPLYDESKFQSAHSDTEKVLSLKLHPIKELLTRFDEKNGEPKLP